MLFVVAPGEAFPGFGGDTPVLPRAQAHDSERSGAAVRRPESPPGEGFSTKAEISPKGEGTAVAARGLVPETGRMHKSSGSMRRERL